MSLPVFVRIAKKVFIESAVIGITSIFVIFILKVPFRHPQSKQSGLPEKTHFTTVAGTIGSSISSRSIDFRQHPLSFLLISSPTCTFCQRSASFHSKLEDIAKLNNVGFYVAVSDLSQAKEYLRRLKLPLQSAIEWKDVDVQVDGTPTLFAINQRSIVVRAWYGMTTPDVEEMILHLVEHPSGVGIDKSGSIDGTTPSYSPIALPGLRSRSRVRVIDVRERHHRIGPYADTQIPGSELLFRAPYELDPSQLEIIDCSNIPLSDCRSAARILQDDNFKVATLGVGLSAKSCSMSRME
jgi:hypothetical protein